MRAFLGGLVSLLFALAVHLLETALSQASGSVAVQPVDRRWSPPPG
jgi:hypothetical protein